MKKSRIIAAALAAVLLVGGAVMKICGADSNKELEPTLPLETKISKEQAVKDLKYVFDTVSVNHPALLTDGNAENKFNSSYVKLRRELMSKDSVTITELWDKSAELVCTLDDAHTIVTVSGTEYVSGGNEISDAYQNGTLLSIDGISADSMKDHFKKVFPCEPQVSFYADYMFGEALQYGSWLTLLGADVSDGIDVVFSGNKETKHFDMTDEPPARKQLELCSYKIDKENSLGVFTLNRCEMSAEYTEKLSEFFGKVKDNDIKNVAVDLRSNGGGTTEVINEFLRYIDISDYMLFGGVDIRKGGNLVSYRDEITPNKRVENAFDGKVYVLTSQYTFSSAMDFAMVIQDNGIGKVIGETPGNMPTAYGDKLSFQLPESKLVLSVSYKKFYRVDITKSIEPLIPDYTVDADKAEEKLVEYIKK